MEVEYPIAVSILVSYFVLILALLWRVRSQLSKTFSSSTPGISLFHLLAYASFLATWTYMIKFFTFSYREWKTNTAFTEPVSLNSISYWLHDVSLFDSAWRQVCVGAWQWLWSHQLCSLTVSVWTPILAIEGTRRGIPYVWAYMILGQVVAISVASSLFFAVMLAYTPVTNKEPSQKLLNSLSVSTVGGILTVILSPFVASGSAFMPNLLVMHILLVFPLVHIESSPTTTNKNSKTPVIYAMILYTLAAGANLAIYMNQWLECLATLTWQKSILYDAYYMVTSTFFGHPAQSSISYDIVCMQFISTAWMWTSSKSQFQQRIPGWVWLTMIMTPVFSASVTLPLFFAASEYHRLINYSNSKQL